MGEPQKTLRLRSRQRPVVNRGSVCRAQCGGNDFEVGVFSDSLLDHATELAGIKLADMCIDVTETFDFEAERCGEVFFVTQHDVDERSEFAIDLKGASLAADGFPETVAVVQVVRNDYAVAVSGFDGLLGDQRVDSESAAKMPPV